MSMTEYRWFSDGEVVSADCIYNPLVVRLLDLTYAAAVLESLGPEASHIAGGVWSLVNSVMDELCVEVDSDQLLELATEVILTPEPDKSKERWLWEWAGTNGWELLFRSSDPQCVAGLFDQNKRLVELAQQNLAYDYASFALHEEEGAHPGPYLGFITAAVLLKVGSEGKIAGQLEQLVEEKLNDDIAFARSMERICAWPDAEKPAAVMQSALGRRLNGHTQSD